MSFQMQSNFIAARLFDRKARARCPHDRAATAIELEVMKQIALVQCMFT
jgi:hypothetical protein